MTALRATPSNSIAPWAEIVPHMPPMTTDELDLLPEDGWTYELVNGILVRLPLSSGKASSIGARLAAHLRGCSIEINVVYKDLVWKHGGETDSEISERRAAACRAGIRNRPYG